MSEGIQDILLPVWMWRLSTSLFTALCLALIYFIKKWINKQEAWKNEADEQGGFVTRDQFFEWCEQKQTRYAKEILYRVEAIEDWREHLMEKGGALVRQEHAELCEKVTEKVMSKALRAIEEGFRHQSDLFRGQVELVKATLQNEVLREIRALKEGIKTNGMK